MPAGTRQTKSVDVRRSARQRQIQLGQSWAIAEDDDHTSSDDMTEEDDTPDDEIEDDGQESAGSEPATQEEQDNKSHVTSVQFKSEEFTPPSERPEIRETRRRRAHRTRPNAAEPDLVMPLLDQSSMDGSWVSPKPPGPESKMKEPRSSQPRKPSAKRLRESTSSSGPNSRARSDNVSSSERPTSSRRRRKEKEAAMQTPSTEDVLRMVSENAMSGLATAGSWLGYASGGLIRRLIFYAFFLLPFFVIGLWTRSYVMSAVDSVSSTVSFGLSPICHVPGLPVQYLPFCASSKLRRQRTNPVEFEQMMNLQTKFEQVLESSSAGLDLPMDMKRGETSLRDLRQRVRFSTLPAKNEMVLEFDGFIDTSRMASHDLQKYNSHIGRAVDNVLATTRWTKRVLDDVAHHEAGKGLLQSTVLDPLGKLVGRTSFTEKAVLDQYIQHASTVEEEINRLIEEAQALLMLLINLEDRLDVIHGIVTREIGHAELSKAEKYSAVWSWLGRNRDILNQLGQRVNLLEEVGRYRRTAVEHVTRTLIRLEEIAAGLEDLRERVATPGLLRGRSDIPLRVHLESIESGVERLEMGRLKSRRIENDYLRKALGQGDPPESLSPRRTTITLDRK